MCSENQNPGSNVPLWKKSLNKHFDVHENLKKLIGLTRPQIEIMSNPHQIKEFARKPLTCL